VLPETTVTDEGIAQFLQRGSLARILPRRQAGDYLGLTLGWPGLAGVHDTASTSLCRNEGGIGARESTDRRRLRRCKCLIYGKSRLYRTAGGAGLVP
jgi:hypothetical protein